MILASLFRGRSWSIRHHSDCAIGAERIKRFVNVYLHCIGSNLKKISNMSTLLPPWKNFCGCPCLYVSVYHKRRRAAILVVFSYKHITVLPDFADFHQV